MGSCGRGSFITLASSGAMNVLCSLHSAAGLIASLLLLRPIWSLALALPHSSSFSLNFKQMMETLPSAGLTSPTKHPSASNRWNL